MYIYRIWDKKSDINGVSCEEIFETRKDLKNTNDDIFLIEDAYGIVTEIQFKRSIQSIYNMPKELTVEQVAQEYLRIKEDEQVKAEKQILTLEEQQEKISVLQEENKAFEEEQEKQNEEILTTMLANAEVFEMVLGMIPAEIFAKERTIKNGGGNSMVEVYVTLILKGVKTMEEVPVVLREQVRERLAQLEAPVK